MVNREKPSSILAGCVLQSYGDHVEEPVDNVLLGKKIKQERLRSNLSLEQLSKIVGINMYKLSRLEHGRDKLTPSQLKDLADAFSVTVEELYRPPDRMVTYISLQKVRRGQYPGRPKEGRT